LNRKAAANAKGSANLREGWAGLDKLGVLKAFRALREPFGALAIFASTADG